MACDVAPALEPITVLPAPLNTNASWKASCDVGVGVGVLDVVALKVTDTVSDGVRLGVSVGEGRKVGVTVWLRVTDGVNVGDGDTVGVCVVDDDSDGVIVGVVLNDGV